jgi:hypothetical protein
MSYTVLDGRMYEGLKLMLNANSNVSAFSEHEITKGSSYYYISNVSMPTGSLNLGSSTFIGTFNIDFITNNLDPEVIKNQKSKLMEVLADNNYYRTSTVTYFFNGKIIDIVPPDEDDTFAFRAIYEITHTKVS